MELQTISRVSGLFGVSARTLRYYEQIGLITASRKEDSAYRVYDADALARLRQIIVLRKLRIPLRQIADIVKNGDARAAVEAFEQSLSEIEDELAALSVIRGIVKTFIERLKLGGAVEPALMDDASLLEVVDSLTASKISFREEKTMEDLNRAAAKMNKLTDKDVRIVYLPPSDVAAYQAEGDEPEAQAGRVVNRFVLDSDLPRIKPDLRHYGFNAPNPDMNDPSGAHGYEMWVTIPEGFDLPAPLVRKHFGGGLYAAHMIPMGAFEEWAWFERWVQDSEKYAYNGNGDPSNMFGSLEECLNYVNCAGKPDWDGVQLDLLIPVREKTQS
ncbi:MAG: effector binding domain-containing protein [Oscillospiraceae bacterium]|jgi:DNA-binding transcriptional MerR regulator|nr:effector binding domain-containing protein [Oscillospiraceae bacterium]